MSVPHLTKNVKHMEEKKKFLLKYRTFRGSTLDRSHLVRPQWIYRLAVRMYVYVYVCMYERVLSSSRFPLNLRHDRWKW